MHVSQAPCLNAEHGGREPAGASRNPRLDDLARLAATVLGATRALVLRHDGAASAIVGHAGFGTGGEPVFAEAEVLARISLLDRDGRHLGTLVVMRDEASQEAGADALPVLNHVAAVAAQALAQAVALARAEDRLRDVFHHNPLPMWIYDAESLNFLDVNEAAVAFYGHSRATFLGMTVLDIRPPAERARMVAAVRDGSDLDASSTWRHCRAGGVPVDVVTHGRAIVFEGRDAVLVAVLDRTDVQALRHDLGQTQLTLDTILAALPVGIFLKDMADGGRYVIYNPAVSEIAGRPAETVIGRCDRDVFGAADSADFGAQDRRIMASGRQLVIAEEPITRPNGEIRRIRTVKKPLPMLDGRAPRYLLGVSEDVTERRASEERMAHMASHDSLTDLPNRAAFEQHLARMLGAPRRSSGTVALLCLDLDEFKAVNDAYGHAAGDTLLRQAAARLRAVLRRAEIVARLGGDEFAVVSRVAGGAPDAEALAARVLKALAPPFELGTHVAHVGSSIGIALAGPGQTADRLMRHADIALYVAKGEGRGTARFYAETMSAEVEARQLLSEDLRGALAAGQFMLSYQPLHHIGSDRISGFEALLRWQHPTRGLVPPGEFIPLTEQNGLIVELGAWVLGEACRQAARWPDDIKIAVNLSAVQFRKPGLVRIVKEALRASGISPGRLELEITESILLADSGSNLQALHDLRALGIRIAMDDFGTGYSSLSYLRSFPFDKIKMDRSFVADMGENPGSMAIVRAITGLGSSLSITTTAEGIETPEQFARLKQEGFDELQGYLIGRPMPADQAEALAGARDRPTFEGADDWSSQL